MISNVKFPDFVKRVASPKMQLTEFRFYTNSKLHSLLLHLLTFPRKIQGVADTTEEVDMQLKSTFFFPVIRRSFLLKNPMVDP